MDETMDIKPDEMFYVSQSDKDGKWRLFDCDECTARYDTRAEIIAFVKGLWRGMAVHGEVDLTCAIYDRKGNLIDTITSEEVLAGQ